MSKYLIESDHTKEECLKALDELAAKGAPVLDQYEFGCAAGVHTCWATVDASNENDARKNVPEFLWGKTRVVPVGHITVDQIRAYHK